jgi:hypothetical protein
LKKITISENYTFSHPDIKAKDVRVWTCNFWKRIKKLLEEEKFSIA